MRVLSSSTKTVGWLSTLIVYGIAPATGNSNVGIGTAAPDSPLDVQADKSGFAANITNHGTGTGLAITSLGGNILALANAQGIKTTFTNDGSLKVSEYIQLALTSNAPPAGDCDEETEAGRMKFDPTANSLYLCSGASGWVSK